MSEEYLYFNHLLIVLRTYVEKEQEGIELTEEEQDHYVSVVEELKDNNIEIPFGIEI